jgi:asparagine synthetase B (glutamine-hydrolysing)
MVLSGEGSDEIFGGTSIRSHSRIVYELTLPPTPRISTRNVSSESRTYTLPIVYVPTSLPWLGVLRLEFHSSTRSS